MVLLNQLNLHSYYRTSIIRCSCSFSCNLATVAYLCGVVGVLSGGLIEMSALNYIPLMASHWPTYLTLLAVGLIFTGIYFVVFRS